jgi:hypothetical protein
MLIETVTEWHIIEGKEVYDVKIMKNEPGNMCDIRQRKRGILLSTACKLKLERRVISDRGLGVLCCQNHAN